MADLDLSLKENDLEPDLLKRLSVAIRLTSDVVVELLSNEDLNCEMQFEELPQIDFNKHQLPPLLARLLFFHKSYLLECHKLTSTAEIYRPFLEKDLASIREFFTTYSVSCQYYLSGATSNDWYLFTMHNEEAPPPPGNDALLKIWNKLNPACLLVSCLLANRQYIGLLREEMSKPSQTQHPAASKRNISWNYSKTDLVEQVLGQFESDTTKIDGKPATLEALMEEAQDYYNVSLKDYHNLLQHIRDRKDGPDAHHQRLADGIHRRVDALLEGRRRKRTSKTD
jgi:RteC protein